MGEIGEGPPERRPRVHIISTTKEVVGEIEIPPLTGPEDTLRWVEQIRLIAMAFFPLFRFAGVY